MSEPLRRGPYAKGVARREQILREALAAYAESDSSGPSLRSIAARVGLSERGLLHYFASREELLIAILAERDAADRARFDASGPVSELSAVVENSAHTPGLVRLFSEMAAAAPDPTHAAHDHFRRRYADLREILEGMLRREAADSASAASASPEPMPEVDVAFAARMLIAASDGLQQQWLLDPTIDLQSDLRRFAELFTWAVRARGAQH
jgi:AcrR family transcriptional regulator